MSTINNKILKHFWAIVVWYRLIVHPTLYAACHTYHEIMNRQLFGYLLASLKNSQTKDEKLLHTRPIKNYHHLLRKWLQPALVSVIFSEKKQSLEDCHLLKYRISKISLQGLSRYAILLNWLSRKGSLRCRSRFWIRQIPFVFSAHPQWRHLFCLFLLCLVLRRTFIWEMKKIEMFPHLFCTQQFYWLELKLTLVNKVKQSLQK